MHARSAGLGFWLAATAAYGQHLVFTMLTPASSPVVISSVSSSRDFGFQSADLLNDSRKTIESLRLKVFLRTTRAGDEAVDGGRVFAKLEPGERKSVDLFLGRRQALNQRAKELKLEVVRAIVTVESVDFSDGTQWNGDEPVQGTPVDPPRPPQ